jgi:hypothetical protein
MALGEHRVNGIRHKLALVAELAVVMKSFMSFRSSPRVSSIPCMARRLLLPPSIWGRSGGRDSRVNPDRGRPGRDFVVSGSRR